MNFDEILLAHGGGGRLTGDLISGHFVPHFRNDLLEKMEDGAVFNVGGSKLCFSTDSFVVNPLFFPGGDIGSLAVHGTVNDLSMCGGKPLYLSCAFILEEGFPIADLNRIVESMGRAAQEAGVQIVTGDTKVVAKGSGDGIFINTAGVGLIEYENKISTASIKPGDTIIVNGFIGDHGAAIMSLREGLGLQSEIESDSAPLNSLVADILSTSDNIRCMRDATRGGLGAILAEIAEQTGHRLSINERDIPLRDSVRGVCEILGLDPLFLANEGKMVAFCPSDEAESVLKAMRNNPYGKDSAIIGQVEENSRGQLIMNTSIGGQRAIDIPAGELLPRIC